MKTKENAAEYRLTQWTGLIQTRKADGETIEQFCESRGISRNAYYYWQRKVREACAQVTKQPDSKSANKRGFAEVVLREPEARWTSQIEMEYKGIRIHIDGTYPVIKIAALIREVTGI